MHKIKKIAIVTLFFTIVDILICFLLDRILFRNFSNMNTLIINLLLNFFIIRWVYNQILKEFKLVSVISGIIGFIISLIVSFYQYYLLYLQFGEMYPMNELLVKIIFAEPFAILMLFDLIYSVYKLLTLQDLNRKISEFIFESLIAITFILSSVLYNQYIEKQNIGRNNIRYFISIIDQTIYTIDTSEYYDIQNEVNSLEESFYHTIYSIYDFNYFKEELVFDKMEDYIDTHRTTDDVITIKSFLRKFEQDFNTFLKQNIIVTDKKINEFIINRTEEFNTLVSE